MTEQEVLAELKNDPFIPLRVHLANGKTLDVPFREVAQPLKNNGLVVLIGLKRGTHQAKSFDWCAFDDIVQIERRPEKRGRQGRKKAS
jgi:hypothetical protein